MADNSFRVGDTEFKLLKINAMKQFHIVRRIAPILSEMLPAMKEIAKKNKEEASEEERLDMAVKFAGPIMNGLSRLSEADSEKVLYALLAAVEMKEKTGNWSKLVQGDQLMFDNLPLPTLLNAAGRSFAHNMAGFFDVLQRST